MRYLVTGAGGFAGHHLLEHVLASTDAYVIATDSFRHKGKMSRITQVLDARPEFTSRTEIITHDLNKPFSRKHELCMKDSVDYIIAYASESHVDRSIDDPVPFVQNNVNVALQTMELARAINPKAVVWVSTDEVYGPVTRRSVKGVAEWAPAIPSNPYSASKAAQEAICISYWRTYGVPLIILNCMNMIGERQDAEKFVPFVVKSLMAGEEVPIHTTNEPVADPTGSRHYLHARNLAHAITFLLARDKIGMYPHWAQGSLGHVRTGRPDRYNVATETRLSNFKMASLIADYAGYELKYRLVDAHTIRPGHDAHYGLDASKLQKLGWEPPVPFEESLKRTISWTVNNPEWLLPD
jgi:dTDP-glucose 4,6-dehydratase